MSIQDSIGPADRSKAREQINCWLIVVSAEESDAWIASYIKESVFTVPPPHHTSGFSLNMSRRGATLKTLWLMRHSLSEPSRGRLFRLFARMRCLLPICSIACRSGFEFSIVETVSRCLSFGRAAPGFSGRRV